MNIETIDTQKAPAAIGPYSQAKKTGDFVFTSGQLPMDPETGEIISGDIELQAMQALENLKAVLAEAGVGMGNVIKTTVFLSDMGDFARMNEVYSDYFPDKPSRSCVEVAKLPKNVKIEIEAIGLVGGME